MKKLILTLALLFTASAAVACNFATAVLAFDDDDIYALEAIGATELLKQTLALTPSTVSAPRADGSGLVLLADTTAGATTTTTQDPETTTATEPTTTVGPIVGSDLETVNKYLNMIESYLGGDNGLSVTSVASDRVGYEYKIVYVFNDILGADKTITIYYNISGTGVNPDDGTPTTTTEGTTTAAPETTTVPETTAAPDTTTVPETTTEPVTTITPDTTAGATPLALPLSGTAGTGELDVEVLSTINGVIVYDDVEYVFEGEKVVEGAEEIFRMRAAVDNANFVRVTYKLDDDGEQKFFHEIVVDGIVVESSKTKVEIGTNGIEASLEFIQGGATGKYDFEIVTVDAITEILVHYETVSAEGVAETGQIRITATVDPFSGVTTYEYVIAPEGASESYYEGCRDDHRHGSDDEIDDVVTDDIEDDVDTGDTEDDVDTDDSEEGFDDGDDVDTDDIEDDVDAGDVEDDEADEADETEDEAADEADETEDEESDEADEAEDDEDEADDTVALPGSGVSTKF